jgi:hypothetical protein
MNRRWYFVGAALLALSFTLTACGDGDGSADSDNTSATKPAAGEAAETPAAAATDEAEPSGDIRTFTLADAQALLDKLPLTPADLKSKWAIGTDTTQDNTAAAVTDPNAGASFERCGRLLSRLVVNMPEDTVTRYIGGETVSFFSTATVYATSEGAADCALEAATRFAVPGELAKAFGTVFIDPATVVVTPVTYPTVADGSFAAKLAGKIEAAGTIVDLTILIVAFRQGNVTAVVGSAAAFEPSVDEVQPLVDLLLQRIKDAQS